MEIILSKNEIVQLFTNLPNRENTSNQAMISFSEAFQLILNQIQSLGSENIDLATAPGRVAAENLISAVDSPSVNVSLKDGFAVISSDIKDASPKNQIPLKLVGMVTAGARWDGEIKPGQALRVLSGAPVPEGADAVLAEEFTNRKENEIKAINDADPGRNILDKGSDVAVGKMMVSKGTILFPQKIGLLAAAGFSKIPVVRRPRIGILATGDEVIAPGEPLVPGRLYASNLVTLAAWCHKFGFEVKTMVVKDREGTIRKSMIELLEGSDALLTSGGAWSGERDLVVKILTELGWKKIFHRVRMGPGKAVGFGEFDDKPVFCLPGGPPSNHMAFLQLALPGLQIMAGITKPGLPSRKVRIAETITGHKDWTQFVHGTIKTGSGESLFYPIHQKSRLQMISNTEGIVIIPEGQTLFNKDDIAVAQNLTW